MEVSGGKADQTRFMAVHGHGMGKGPEEHGIALSGVEALCLTVLMLAYRKSNFLQLSQPPPAHAMEHGTSRP